MEYRTTVASLENGQNFTRLDDSEVFTAVATLGPDHILAESNPPGRPQGFRLDVIVMAFDNHDNN